MAIFYIILLLFLAQLPDQTEQTLYFGTETVYFQSSKSSPEYPKGCRPVHINYVSRHGARFSSKGDREMTTKLLKKLDNVYNTSSPFRYENLTLPWTEWLIWKDAESQELSPRGELEQYEIAKRWRLYFPQVFDKPYWNKYYQFIARDRRRTLQSAVAFAFGLFENETGSLGRSKFQPVAIKSTGPGKDDKLLSSYDACPRYSVDVKGNGLDDYEKFITGEEIQNIIKTMEQRLRINGTLSLNFQDVDTIRKLCAFGIMNHNDDNWCSLLDSQSLDVLNYASDLKNYYDHSHGNDLSYTIICVLLGNITHGLEEFSKGTSEFRGVFRFASSGTLFSLLTILGLFDNGTALRADNFKQSSNRKFPSKFVPMSANVAFVLYTCNSTDIDGSKHVHKVQILVNEKPVVLPCCQGNLNCSLGDFLTYFKNAVDSCKFDTMCSLPSTPKAFASIVGYDISLMTIIFIFALTAKSFRVVFPKH